ncbi:MAG: hypothetical protein JSS16_07220 [Proteobacteria bacterium]|uniref:hypothetical protein n=1 Tax=Rudaea sp. TaxID=2136325 RepID=UPI001DC41E42|nr:hypothetical protein [Pseudomonadota bacterium]MBS0567986.1 hypothetical protein [Pseudomonadota bacterium]
MAEASATIATDTTGDTLHEAVPPFCLVEIKACAVDAVRRALKFGRRRTGETG